MYGFLPSCFPYFLFNAQRSLKGSCLHHLRTALSRPALRGHLLNGLRGALRVGDRSDYRGGLRRRPLARRALFRMVVEALLPRVAGLHRACAADPGRLDLWACFMSPSISSPPGTSVSARSGSSSRCFSCRRSRGFQLRLADATANRSIVEASDFGRVLLFAPAALF